MAARDRKEHSMIRVILVDPEDVAIKLGTLRAKTPVVITRASNRAAQTARTEIEKETMDINLVRKKDVRGISTLKKASYGYPMATLTYQDGFKNLSKWIGAHGKRAVRPMKPHVGTNKNPKNYFAHVKRKNPAKALIGDDPIPFIQVAKSLDGQADRDIPSRAYPLRQCRRL